MVYRLPWRRPLAAHAAPAMRQPRPVQSIGRATRLQHCTAPVAAGAARCLLLYHAIGPGVWRLAKHYRGVAICPSCPSHRSGVAARPDAAASSVIISHVRATTGQSKAGGEHWQHAGGCVPTIAHHCPPRPVESRPRHPIHDRQPPIPQAHLSANFPSRPISARPLERIARPLGRRSGDEQPHAEASACSPPFSRQREQGVRSTARSAARREPRRDRTLAETRHTIPVPRGVCVSMAPRPLRGRMTKEKPPRTAQPSHQAGARLRICNSSPRARPFPVERSAAKPTLARFE